ncbi:hypothetical protein FS749_012136 [Ceratobasidium sp. UAMH 11750]|nr:hypothetical protein FS749_012136 [Ceratobasidium sp. UAMH 11750]
MAKVKSAFRCPHCPASRPTFAGVKRHISLTPACAKKEAQKIQKRTGAKPNFLRRRRTPPPSPPPPPPPPPSSPPSRAQTPSTTAADNAPDVEMENVGPEHIRRSPGVTIEEYPDEPYLQTRRPTCRNSHATIEEVPEIVIPLSAHPRAEPTRWSLFPEAHPDPTAGKATWFEPITDIPPPLYDTSLTEPDVFREAYWLGNLPISKNKMNEYFSLPRTCNWYWKNVKQFDTEIDNLPHGPDWYRQTVRVQTDDGEEVLDLWKRDVVEVVKWLISDRRFMEYMRFAPERHWTTEARQERVYDEMWSGDWWWRTQNILGEGSTIAPIILATDKTQMTMLSGNKSAWPVYLSIGNISKDIRRRASERAMVLVGFIPVTDLPGIQHVERRRETRWQLFHTCMESILEPLKEASRLGVEMFCADGGIRRVHPILAAYLADYKEQTLVTCVRDNRCPVCWVPGKERADYNQQYSLRGKHETMRNLEDHWAGDSRGVETLGIRPNRPFWADLPYVDIFNCMAPDMLHQLNKGIFGKHVVKWCRSIMGKDTIDCRLKATPRFSGLRHFAQGISVIKQWTGNEWKTLAKIFLPTLAGCSKPEAAAATRNVLDFMYCVHKPEISDSDLEDLDGYLASFHDLKGVFVGTEKEREKMKDLLDSDERFHGIPKLHMIGHYLHFIRELGTPDGYNTEVPERLHIDYVKVPWRASNHVNATEQMTTFLQRREAWAFLRAYLHDTGALPDPRYSEADGTEGNGAEGNDAEGEPDEDDEDSEDDDGEVWYPKPTLSVAKRPTLGKKSLAYLIKNHGAEHVIPATLRFLNRLPTTRPGSDLPLDRRDVVPVWTRCRLTHKRLPFLPSVGPQVDRVRTLPLSVDSEGRVKRAGAFDVVLFQPDNVDEGVSGLHRFQAGRIRAIFELPRHLQPYYNQKLAYLELFRPFSVRPQYPMNLYSTSHKMDGPRRCAVVIPLSRLRMACHLVPQYQSLDPELRISSSTDLLAVHNHFYFNKYASHPIFAIMDHWRKQVGHQRIPDGVNNLRHSQPPARNPSSARPSRHDPMPFVTPANQRSPPVSSISGHSSTSLRCSLTRQLGLYPDVRLVCKHQWPDIPARLWSVEFYRLLESLRHASAKSPAAFEHLNDYI